MRFCDSLHKNMAAQLPGNPRSRPPPQYSSIFQSFQGLLSPLPGSTAFPPPGPSGPLSPLLLRSFCFVLVHFFASPTPLVAIFHGSAAHPLCCFTCWFIQSIYFWSLWNKLLEAAGNKAFKPGSRTNVFALSQKKLHSCSAWRSVTLI